MARLFNRPTRTINETVNGVPVEYTVPDTTPAPPKLPFNLDATLRRILFAVAVLMTVGAIVWGTVAIGGMLLLLAPAWAAYLVSGVFDAGWAAALIAAWLLRYDSTRATVPNRAGLAMLTVSMTAIVIDGVRTHAVLVGIVGALVSAAAKGVWAIGMHTIRIKLDPKYEAYLRTLQQQAGTEQALALGEWDRMRTGDRTVRLRVALEARRPDGTTVDQIVNPAQSTPVQAADQPVDQIESTPEPQPVQAVHAGANRPVQPEDQVDLLVTLLRKGEHITKSRAAEILGVPESTAYRRLTKATSVVNQYN
ncbi:hypothetical protein AQI95_24735 [Streptomyces yokosukanensis]|uniref:Protein transporter Sec31 n=1 Tax=Streptomyces yokosukanensis TaxID=67386 RepID=A0A101P1F1_9ACTN|nr:hypothetical protein [Streptomyces yokosukanensis]KUN03166.1 hypothetical protein AQI95_24735 [Streptomyces yokosukanensis]